MTALQLRKLLNVTPDDATVVLVDTDSNEFTVDWVDVRRAWKVGDDGKMLVSSEARIEFGETPHAGTGYITA
jgi:hypothetical protein